MREFARILVVDDHKPMADMIAERLRDHGYEVESSYEAADALDRLAAVPPTYWSVVILDRKLAGYPGADVGVDILGKILGLAPTIKPILITAYADPDSVERAFRNGAYDYVVKGTEFKVLEALLLAKIRNALEPAREARIAALSNGEREERLVKLWQAVQAETSRQKKGARLEELMLVLWRSIPGFEKTVPNVRGRGEELDLVVVNQSNEEFWRRESSLFIIECKNWTARVDPKEIAHLFDKMELRSGRCRLGFFVAPEGFTTGALGNLETRKRGDKLCVALAREELEALVHAGGAEPRNRLLQDLVVRALV